MAFEALNDIGQAQTPLVIILNDNEMSISRNVGAMAIHLGQIRMSSNYRKSRDSVQGFMESSLGLPGKAMVRLGKSAKESFKQFVMPGSMLFEQLGIVCTPPIDGHDITGLKRHLKSAFEMNSPVILHVVTKKGAGYLPAEQNPSAFHGVGSFDLDTGAIHKKSSVMTYTKAFSHALMYEAKKDSDICAISAAMVDGTGLTEFSKTYPDRCFDVGIAEEHAVGMSSGLAIGGKKPVVAVYSTFFQRAIDQLIINVGLPRLNVVFAVDRAGLVGDDGPTHHGVFDLVYTRMVPHVRVLAPSDEAELFNALHTALALDGPVVLRYPRGEAEGVQIPEGPVILEEGVSRVVREGKDVALLAFGRMVKYARQAADILEQQGIDARVVDMRWVKPLDKEAIKKAGATKLVVTIEEGVISGGVGEAVLKVLSDEHIVVDALTLGIPDDFVDQGKVDLLFKDLGLDAQGIAKRVKKSCLNSYLTGRAMI